MSVMSASGAPRPVSGTNVRRWQVSWLAGLHLTPTFPVAQWSILAPDSPLTVAGAATAWRPLGRRPRVPYYP